ncbi:5-oxoprolinase subunit PxpB [Antarcticibacterium sp. 1MA-6-2]|uniref:5-oxoprolinase subunit PxpB n=1 Tax=Antarcticibacterium sp. 1MA-6-2 TaxID=2908210 RepID=UPI001F2BE081|nr:5-oxoprolinase subunit PxpB [Antarcticibacterium sp. 1MA-6-2]UJH91232.1 5-oxoprolinase subunit PxpB [Antarcticibacterium sp. 1MA-6-2]
MSLEFSDIKPMGERAILIEFEPEINQNTLEKVLLAREIINSKKLKQKVEVITAYNSLLINYKSPIEDIYREVLEVKMLLRGAKIGKNEQRLLFHIPVCYDADFGWDLDQISGEKELSFEEVVQLHSKPIYTVYFIGFLPGFLYLGGLPEILNFPRKNEPRMEVPKGAVGIGGNQTGIYPKKSPGGWQIIGNSPVDLFNKNTTPPCQISAGDKVKFYPVSKTDYFTIKDEVESGNYQLENEKFHD